nr:hypothetical protein [Tanacetum cinerariifolium]
MDHQYPTVAKIPVLDTGKFEQWQFRIQQYLQHEHYALWEVIKFSDSYKVPTNTDPDDTTTKRDVEQSGRTVTYTTEDIQKKKNDVKARTTLLLSLPDEHQLRNDLDSMSLDDLYNHLKVYEAEVQKKSNLNSQDMAFISSSKNSSNEDGNTDINQIDEDDMEEMDIKWNMALLSMRADKEPRSQERGRKESYRQGPKTKEKSSKALMAIDRVKKGVGYNAVPPPAADLYLSPKKDLSWTGLLEFMDDTVTDYSRPSPTVVSASAKGQNKDSSTTEDVASPNPPKPFVKFVKPKDSQPKSKSKEQETPKKSQVKYAEQYKHSNKRPKGNQRNRNNLKSCQLGPEFVLHKKPCFNYGDFSHLANDCKRRVQRETTRSQNHPYKSSSHRSGGHRPHGAPMRPPLRSSGHRPHKGSMRPPYRSAGHRPHGPSINPRRPTMYVKTPYRAPWVPTINRYDPPVNRKFSTGRRNFPTANRKFPTASRKFTTGSWLRSLKKTNPQFLICRAVPRTTLMTKVIGIV